MIETITCRPPEDRQALPSYEARTAMRPTPFRTSFTLASRTGWLCLTLLAAGCASWTNPVANGIPVRLLPTELLAESKESLETIPLTYLRRRPIDEYTLGPGDVLGIYIAGVLGEETQVPQVTFPQTANLPPAVGFPIPVREDGTISLPYIKAVDVRGLTTGEAEQRIVDAYTVDRQILQPDEARILLTVARPRQARILVLREDSPQGQRRTISRSIFFGTTSLAGDTRRGTGAIIELPEVEADVLSALAQTGGLPGGDAANEVIIQRGYAGELSQQVMQRLPQEYRQTFRSGSGEPRIVRIPLRMPPGTPPGFTAEDVALQDGDIVFVDALDFEFYYTGGVLPSLEVPIPRDYDLDVVEAVSRIGGTILRGGINGNNVNGLLVANGIGGPNPSLLTVLRRLPDGSQVPIRVDLNEALRDPRENILVQAGDILILQETPGEAFSRYLSDVLNLRIDTFFLRTNDVFGQGTLRHVPGGRPYGSP
jgi:protein involved in polysaccharide export with SLBB domain